MLRLVRAKEQSFRSKQRLRVCVSRDGAPLCQCQLRIADQGRVAQESVSNLRLSCNLILETAILLEPYQALRRLNGIADKCSEKDQCHLSFQMNRCSSTHEIERFGDGRYCNKIAQVPNLETHDCAHRFYGIPKKRVKRSGYFAATTKTLNVKICPASFYIRLVAQ
jgi:hypothetical protein